MSEERPVLKPIHEYLHDWLAEEQKRVDDECATSCRAYGEPLLGEYRGWAQCLRAVRSKLTQLWAYDAVCLSLDQHRAKGAKAPMTNAELREWLEGELRRAEHYSYTLRVIEGDPVCLAGYQNRAQAIRETLAKLDEPCAEPPTCCGYSKWDGRHWNVGGYLYGISTINTGNLRCPRCGAGLLEGGKVEKVVDVKSLGKVWCHLRAYFETMSNELVPSWKGE